jgi:integrase
MATVIKNDGGGYTVRYREPGGRAGRQREKTFRLKRDADAFAAKVETAKVTGTYVDISAGRRTFGEYADQWLAGHTVRQSTRDTYGAHLRNSILPRFDRKPLSSVLRSDVMAWVKERADAGSAPSTIRTAYKVLSMVFRSAVDDGLIAKSPCYRITNLPKVPRKSADDVVALTPAQVLALAAAVPGRYRALVILVAGTGPPKTDASYRTVPLPKLVVDELAAHLATFPANADGLIFTSPRGCGVRRNRFHESWAPAVKAAGLPRGTHFHYLRHTYASLLIAAKEPPKVVQERLGHSSITETMDTYGHLYPESEESTRTAIDQAFAPRTDSVLTKEEGAR